MTAVTDSRTIRNGVDTEQLFGTLDLIKAQPELARFQFRATNRWIDGSHNRSTIKGFYAAGAEDEAGQPRGYAQDQNSLASRSLESRTSGAAAFVCLRPASSDHRQRSRG